MRISRQDQSVESGERFAVTERSTIALVKGLEHRRTSRPTATLLEHTRRDETVADDRGNVQDIVRHQVAGVRAPAFVQDVENYGSDADDFHGQSEDGRFKDGRSEDACRVIFDGLVVDENYAIASVVVSTADHPVVALLRFWLGSVLMRTLSVRLFLDSQFFQRLLYSTCVLDVVVVVTNGTSPDRQCFKHREVGAVEIVDGRSSLMSGQLQLISNVAVLRSG